MVVATKQTAAVSYSSGAPASATVFEKIDFGFRSTGLKINVSAGNLEISFDGVDVHGILPTRAADYDFIGFRETKIYVRITTATFKAWAWL